MHIYGLYNVHVYYLQYASMHTYMHANVYSIHIYIHMYIIHTYIYINTLINTCRHTHRNASTKTCIHTCIDTQMHACLRLYMFMHETISKGRRLSWYEKQIKSPSICACVQQPGCCQRRHFIFSHYHSLICVIMS